MLMAAMIFACECNMADHDALNNVCMVATAM